MTKKVAAPVAHDMDPVTQYCRKCGAAEQEIVEKNLVCTSAENIIGISHRVRGKRLATLASGLLPPC